MIALRYSKSRSLIWLQYTHHLSDPILIVWLGVQVVRCKPHSKPDCNLTSLTTLLPNQFPHVRSHSKKLSLDRFLQRDRTGLPG